MSRTDDRLAQVAQSLLAPGESLQGCLIATRVVTFSAAPMVVAVTAGRLIVQPVDRKLEAKGLPLSLPPESIASASFGDVSGGGSIAAIVVDGASLKLVVRTTGGEKLALTMMTGVGPLGGGETQRAGVEALVDWIAAHT